MNAPGVVVIDMIDFPFWPLEALGYRFESCVAHLARDAKIGSSPVRCRRDPLSCYSVIKVLLLAVSNLGR